MNFLTNHSLVQDALYQEIVLVQEQRNFLLLQKVYRHLFKHPTQQLTKLLKQLNKPSQRSKYSPLYLISLKSSLEARLILRYHRPSP
jgi:hypothetical protein